MKTVAKMPLGTFWAMNGYYTGWAGFSGLSWGNFSTNLYYADGITFENLPLSIGIGAIAPGGAILLEALLTEGKSVQNKERNKNILLILASLCWVSWLAVGGVLYNPNSTGDIDADLALILTTALYYLQIAAEVVTASAFLMLAKMTKAKYAQEVVKTPVLLDAYEKKLKTVLPRLEKKEDKYNKAKSHEDGLTAELELYKVECADGFEDIRDILDDKD